MTNTKINSGKIVLCDRNILSAFVFNKMDGISFEYTEKLYDGLRYPDVIILLQASPLIVHNRLLQRETLTRYEKAHLGTEQRVIDESVEYLKHHNVSIFKISTEKTLEESVLETYDFIRKFIIENLNM